MESLGRGGAGVPEFTPRGREPDFPLLPGQLWGPLPLRGGGGDGDMGGGRSGEQSGHDQGPGAAVPSGDLTEPHTSDEPTCRLEISSTN